MTIERTVVVPLRADETFALLTNPAGLRRWQTVSARIDLRAGGDFRWTIVPGHIAAGTIREIESGKRLALTWGWEDADDLPPGSSSVTITLEPALGGTLLRLVHEGLDDSQTAGHIQGWDHYLARLERAARLGDAGPDELASTPNPLDKLSAAEASLATCQVVLRNIGPEAGTLQTPCPQFSIDELVAHLSGSLRGLGAMAGITVEPSLETGLEARIADTAQQTLEAWRVRGLDGTVQVGPMELPAALAANILSIELLVHAWDLAQASKQEVPVSDELSGFVLKLAQELIGPAFRDGVRFGVEVEAPAGANNLARLIAFTGRAA